MNSSIQAQIQCPFFVNERNNLLCCEGFIDGTCMTTRFPDQKTQIAYIEEHCFHMDGGKCHMAKDLFYKYKKLEEQERKYIIQIKTQQSVRKI